MRRFVPFALILLIAAGCLGPGPAGRAVTASQLAPGARYLPAGGGHSVVVTPEVVPGSLHTQAAASNLAGDGIRTQAMGSNPVAGSIRTQAVASNLTAADVVHLVVALFGVDGGTETAVLAGGTAVTQDVPGAGTGSIVFGNLRANTTYRIRGYAYRAAGTAAADLISTTDSGSYVDLTLTDDDRPTLATLRVKLIDIPFSGLLAGGSPGGSGGTVIPGPLSVVSTDSLNLAYGLAPDDAGNPLEHHDYVVTKGEVASTFVWIPRFEAFQLIIPASCGAGNTDKPVGYWVKDQPTSGTRDTDWAREVFGGFYAGKYEASRADSIPGAQGSGSGAAEGTSTTLKVAPRCVPFTNVSWHTIRATCRSYDSHADLMGDDEWTALAVWAMTRGITVLGNNNHLHDIDRDSTTFTDDPTYWQGNPGYRSLTGTGTDPAWTGNQNLTTHTGTTAGVYDLNGNVYEWTGTMGMTSGGSYRIDPGDTGLGDTGVLAPGWNYIGALATTSALRRFGVPGTTGADPLAFLGGDHGGAEALAGARPIRGGNFALGGKAGPWQFNLGNLASNAHPGLDYGFRPVLRFPSTPIARPYAVTTLAGNGTAGYADGTGSAARFANPAGVALDAAGNVYVAELYNHRIRKVSPAGVVTTLAGSGVAGFADGHGTAAQFNRPAGVAVDAAGNIFVADALNERVRKITPAGAVSTIAGDGTVGFVNGNGTAARFSYPSGLAVDGAGNVYVADHDNDAVRKITPAGDVSTLAGNGTQGYAEGVGTAARFDRLEGVAVDLGGNIYVADKWNYRVRKVSPAGVVTTLAGSGAAGSLDGPAPAAQFDTPQAVAVGGDGSVFVADTGNHRLRKVSPNGFVTTLAGTGIDALADGVGTAAAFNGPFGLALSGDGWVYVADFNNHAVRVLR